MKIFKTLELHIYIYICPHYVYRLMYINNIVYICRLDTNCICKIYDIDLGPVEDRGLNIRWLPIETFLQSLYTYKSVVVNMNSTVSFVLNRNRYVSYQVYNDRKYSWLDHVLDFIYYILGPNTSWWFLWNCMGFNNRITLHFQWSFGVVLWEMTTLGLHPYHHLTSVNDIILYLAHGKRLIRSEKCPRDL